ncbi:transglutaminase family protein [Labrys wisconsinensis]|uniref:Transglutaminase-like putative cysteine protease n=1 Tax=Labrys wisconsinensis TaxID=425677 RepID=A0ABU0IYV4_9HYPH|nr:transglutaminase family protein [Labrys wisconsinensis]MDQ0467187.1 transglutaminase-like putative cysteine protease [Labrys wisconsinensis]
MKRLDVTHRTTYRYSEPVAFGPHRMMLRPRDSHEMSLVNATLTTSLPAELTWTYDVFGNVICTAQFDGTTDELSIESHLQVERYAPTELSLFVTGADVAYPLAYSPDELTDLGACLTGSGEPFEPELEAWVQAVTARHAGGAAALLAGLCQEIHAGFTYETRFEESTRSPAETFGLRSGACRDFAAFFIGVARRLGFGARFVSGYLFDPSGGDSGLQGAGATHAWAEVFLPGAGWVEFDPTNGLIASDHLIRVAVTREPHQARPIAGSFVGTPGAFIGLWVGVTVESVESAAEAASVPELVAAPAQAATPPTEAVAA